MAPPDLRTPEAITRALNEAGEHYRQGRFDDADRLCARVLKAAPDYFDAMHLAGLLKLETGKAAAAQVMFTRALKLQPAAAPVHANLGRALTALGRDEEALAAIDRAIALAPDGFDAYNNRGIVLLKLGRAEEAIAAF
jgi:tetratricopeptide (TPR) repeat protein